MGSRSRSKKERVSVVDADFFFFHSFCFRLFFLSRSLSTSSPSRFHPDGARPLHRRTPRAAEGGRPAGTLQGAAGAGEDPPRPLHGQPLHSGAFFVRVFESPNRVTQVSRIC